MAWLFAATAAAAVGRRWLSTGPEMAPKTLPEFGVFKRRLEELLGDKSKLGAFAFNVQGHEPANDNVRRLVHLDLASGPEQQKALRRACIQMFARRPNDTGSPEVQIALSTARMETLKRHIADGHHKDHKTKRLLQQVFHERKRMLKYLRRVSLQRFYTTLDRLGLPATYLQEVERPYMFTYNNNVKKEFHAPANRTIRGGGRFIQDIASRDGVPSDEAANCIKKTHVNK